MSRTAKILLPFDEPRVFRLGIGELEELQERTDAGPEELYARLGTGRWRVADIQQTLRLGLIGAGETVGRAAILIERNAGPGQLIEWKEHARSILLAAIAGIEDEPVVDDVDGEAPSGEPEGEATGSPDQSSGTEASIS